MHVSPEVVLIKPSHLVHHWPSFLGTYHNGHSPRSNATSIYSRRLSSPSYIKDNKPWNQKSINQGFWGMLPCGFCCQVTWRQALKLTPSGRSSRSAVGWEELEVMVIWWFQLNWKICSSIISPSKGENEKSLNPPPSHLIWLSTNVDNWFEFPNFQAHEKFVKWFDCWYCWWKKSCTSWGWQFILLFTGFLYPGWLFGISSINSRCMNFKSSYYQIQTLHRWCLCWLSKVFVPNPPFFMVLIWGILSIGTDQKAPWIPGRNDMIKVMGCKSRKYVLSWSLPVKK